MDLDRTSVKIEPTYFLLLAETFSAGEEIGGLSTMRMPAFKTRFLWIKIPEDWLLLFFLRCFAFETLMEFKIFMESIELFSSLVAAVGKNPIVAPTGHC